MAGGADKHLLQCDWLHVAGNVSGMSGMYYAGRAADSPYSLTRTGNCALLELSEAEILNLHPGLKTLTHRAGKPRNLLPAAVANTAALKQ